MVNDILIVLDRLPRVFACKRRIIRLCRIVYLSWWRGRVDMGIHMADISTSGTPGAKAPAGMSPSGDKLPWHAPALRRLDVNLTGGNVRNGNNDNSGKGGTSHS